VGKGSFGKVYLAVHEPTNQFFAMKVVYIAELKKDPYLLRQMECERELLSRIHHPFIVHFYYTFEDTERFAFLMQFVNGG